MWYNFAMPTSPSTFHIGYIWREYVSCNLSGTNNVTVTHYWLVTDSWIVCSWIVSLAQTFLHCKTFSSDVAEYRICKETFYSTQHAVNRTEDPAAVLTVIKTYGGSGCQKSMTHFLMFDRPTHSQINNSCLKISRRIKSPVFRPVQSLTSSIQILKIYPWQNTHLSVTAHQKRGDMWWAHHRHSSSFVLLEWRTESLESEMASDGRISTHGTEHKIIWR
jgi:hypothetical protein